MSEKHNHAALYRDSAGDYWFLGAFSNNFEDREGEIISWDAHENYAKWFKSSGIKPPLTVMHQPHYPDHFHLIHYLALKSGVLTPEEFDENLDTLYRGVAIGKTEAIIPLNGFMFVAAKLYKDKIPLVKRLKERVDNWGMSHGFIREQFDGNIIKKYVSFEFSVLPIEVAANSITPISIHIEDDRMGAVEKLSAEDRELLETLLEGSTEDLEAKTEEAKAILQRVLASKELTADTEEDTETETSDEDVEEVEAEEGIDNYEGLRDKIMADINIEGLNASMKQVGEVFEQFNTRINEIAERLDAVEVSEDNKIAAQFTAPDWTFGFGIQDKQNQEDDADLLEKLKNELPEDGADIEEKARENPLNLGFWSNFNVPE